MLSIGKNILATFAYFDLFSYPLTKAELKRFLQQEANDGEIETSLHQLMQSSLLFKLNQFYCLHNKVALSKRRIQGNRRATIMLTRAKRAAAIISYFPFVQGVAISGSLSKNYADELSDIDFFVITSANRLWIARSFLHLFKKLTFLVNKQHLFCMNYFIDEQQLLIPEKNIYTATEVVTLIPLYGKNVFETFYIINTWTQQYLPNYQRNALPIKETKTRWFPYLINKALNNKIGDWLDACLMKLTAKSWSKKTKRDKKNSCGITLDLDVSKHYARPNPIRLQGALLSAYEQNLNRLYKRYDAIIHITEEVIK